MDVLGDNDPVSILQQQIIRTLQGHDGGTAIAALSLTLMSTIALASAKTGVPLPAGMLILRDDLTDLVVDILQARATQRES